ncbi:MAG: gamma-glutamyltransferase, partial [Longimicrobiales bacterium]
MKNARSIRFVAVLVAVLFAAGCGTTTRPVATPPAPATPTTPQVQAQSPASAQQGMVVSASAIASAVGADVLKAGGNAIDAAIATGLALAVTYPAAGNIGGGGFMVIRFPDGRATAIDFREKAPLAAHANMFLDSAGDYSSRIHHNSHIAVGVPGTVAGFWKAHGAYGKAEWGRVVESAVRLARDGFAVPPGLARSLQGALNSFQRYPASVAAYSKAGQPYAEGETFKQPDLARTLDRIMREGRDGFYKGETARLLAEEMRRGGGLITEQDLARYDAKERAPVTGTYRGYDIISMPPPSSGGVALVEMLNILEGYDLKSMGHMSAPYIHHLIEAMRRAYLDRARFLADPDFAQVPIERLTSKAYAVELRKTIDSSRATPSAPADIVQPAEGMETTHYSVVDASGMAVSVTYTLEAGYGSKIVVPGAGFLLNNEMGDFNAKPGLTTEAGLIGTEPNLARPEQRMLSSMTPSIIARDGKLVAVVGSPGGRTIINTVLSVTLALIDFGMNIQQAVNAPRLHHQWLPDQVSIEQDGATPETVLKLQAMGHTVRVAGRQGTAHSILIDPRTGARLGAPD